MFKYLPLFLSLSFVLISCGSDDDHSGVLQEEVFEAQDFSTRIDNNLLVEGNQCKGGETTEYDGKVYTCEEGQWLVILDNMNVCTDDGICTEIAVPSIVAHLVETTGDDGNFLYSLIEAVSPVNEEQQRVIESVYVRYDVFGETEVVRR